MIPLRECKIFMNPCIKFKKVHYLSLNLEENTSPFVINWQPLGNQWTKQIKFIGFYVTYVLLLRLSQLLIALSSHTYYFVIFLQLLKGMNSSSNLHTALLALLMCRSTPTLLATLLPLVVVPILMVLVGFDQVAGAVVGDHLTSNSVAKMVITPLNAQISLHLQPADHLLMHT